ncbi:MAG: Hsp70 family protein [Gammaproteobacteria bacterium]|uniref:Hsp70 family protein n=1 Tax=Azohydromonas sp. TaxID=1872666 RepID=UPI002C18469C|nr:Hsp70 family protein [Azohydromonas sp.]HMM86134.1 Hsp70 family protein [Azohydromonas sp.]
MSSWCAIDFGTSNSAVAVARPRGQAASLVAVEDGQATMPTAVFYFTDTDEAATFAGAQRPAGALPRAYGRAAVRAYVEGAAGRLMRSLKSILGSSLAEQSTDLGEGHAVRYLDAVTGVLRRLREVAEGACGAPLERAVLGRPVFFVDDDAQRDARAQVMLERAAHAAGFADVRFQFEPIAAALDHERSAEREQLVLVADIGGGTSDFSLVRIGPRRRGRTDRRDDILASHGVHVAGTDFDRRIELAVVMPRLGLGARGPSAAGAREVPSAIYHDLATWHLINTCYRPQRVAELRAMADWYDDPVPHRRLMHVLDQRLGHDLAARCESAKIEAASTGVARIDLSCVEPALAATLDEATALRALDGDLERIAAAARQTVRLAGVDADVVDALYFTGGSTGWAPLTRRLAADFPRARTVHGDRLASVARGLGEYAARMYGDGG